MRKLLLVLVLTLPVLTASYSRKIKQWVFPERTVSKDITVKVGSINNYRTKAYAHSTAKINITVLKVRDSKVDTLVMESSPEVKLNRLLSFSKTFTKNIHIGNIKDSRDEVIILYNLIYKSKGSVLEVPNAEWILKGNSQNHISINI